MCRLLPFIVLLLAIVGSLLFDWYYRRYIHEQIVNLKDTTCEKHLLYSINARGKRIPINDMFDKHVRCEF